MSLGGITGWYVADYLGFRLKEILAMVVVGVIALPFGLLFGVLAGVMKLFAILAKPFGFYYYHHENPNRPEYKAEQEWNRI